MNYWKEWIKKAGIRAIKTMAQTAVATIGTSAAMGEVNWVLVVIFVPPLADVYQPSNV